MNKINLKTTVLSTILVTTGAVASIFPGSANAGKYASFHMYPSEAAQTCLPKAKARVTIKPIGQAEIMHVEVKGLAPNTEYDFFVIQTPNRPFGMSWYQGDIETNEKGRGVVDFIGRFNEETFIVAPGTDAAPLAHKDSPFPDANTNPPTPPVHTYHLGLWFNSADDATKAGCPGDPTPFNGEHNAGIQVLNTAQFPIEEGPLSQIKP